MEDELLKSLYYNPETGFQGLDKLYRKAKAINSKITRKKVKEWLEQQETNQITKQEKRTKRVYNSIVSPSVRNNFQMDIMFLPNPTRNLFKYLLTCIDVYSRYAFVEPMNRKTGAEVLRAYKKIEKRSGTPNNMNVDMGKEFDNNNFKDYLQKRGTKLWFSNPEEDNKNAIIERFHRTLRGMLLRFEVAMKRPYINDLQKIVNNYNNTEHSTINATPSDVWNGKDKNTQTIQYVNYNFRVGDRVRYLVKRETFDKASSTERYSRDIYTIYKIEGNAYYLESRAGNRLKRKFKGHELKKAVGEGGESKFEEQVKQDKRKEQVKRRVRKEGIEQQSIIRERGTRQRKRADRGFFVE